MLVEALLLGGAYNPTITLNATAGVYARTLAAAAATECAPTTRVLGFSGWAMNEVVVRGVGQLDALLFEQPKFAALPEDVRAHVRSESIRLAKLGGCVERIQGEKSSRSPIDCKADAPVLGPDDPHKVHYDPANDDGGCFETKQRENNCYNYGNDVLTNTFAQPGRGSGVCSHSSRPCVPNTCEDVRSAAESDGLVWAGTTLPTVLPPSGHYVSLHIWPRSNFHWIRMDANMTWSHKPGGSPVRDRDNNGKVITDPGAADFSPWTKHCGYMRTLPSNVTLY